MHRVRFYPVGNGDCSQIILTNEKRLLFDFCHRRKSEDKDDPQIDLQSATSVTNWQQLSGTGSTFSP